MEVIIEHSKVSGYKANIKSQSLSYTSNEQLEFEIRNTVSFTIAIKMDLDINLTKIYRICMQKTTNY